MLIFHPGTVDLADDVYVGHRAILHGYHRGPGLRVGAGTWIGPQSYLHAAGGIVSFAHPGVTKKDALLAPLAEAGLDAVEVHHSDHLPEVREHYRGVAVALGLATSGGSDFHGYGETRATLGVVRLPRVEFEALEARAAARAAAGP